MTNALEHAIQFLDNEHSTSEPEGQQIKRKLEALLKEVAPTPSEKLFKVCVSHHYICKENQIDETKQAFFDDLDNRVFENIEVIEAPDASENDIPDFIKEQFGELHDEDEDETDDEQN